MTIHFFNGYFFTTGVIVRIKTTQYKLFLKRYPKSGIILATEEL